MIFNHKFSGESKVSSNSSEVSMSFAPDVLREPTYFIGDLNKHIAFREVISALHDIVVSDFRFKPKDKSDYKEWAKEQESIWMAEYMKGAADVGVQVKAISDQIQQIRLQKAKILEPLEKSKRNYFKHLYDSNRDAWIVLDPVITVHPDELFFECFSRDESSYGKLGCNYNVFKNVNEFKCGTTNIDYSSALYDEFQKIREYKNTKFTIEPSGFGVQTSKEEDFKEVKIDLPDSWVRGFLQVSSAMTLPSTVLELHPMDVYNMLFILKRKKEKEGPRSIKFILNPGQPVKMIFEPWGIELECPRSPYTGSEKKEIRIWGRRRLMLLERLIPVSRKFTVVLLGNGLPSFYIADLGDMNFTLGLSGWTVNDWSSMGNFDLLAPRAHVDALTMQKVYIGLRENWFEGTDSLAKRLSLDSATVNSALSAFTQAGRVIYDLDKKIYRIRELSRESLPLESLRFANEQEELASRFVDAKRVKLKVEDLGARGIKLTGLVTDKSSEFKPELVLDKDQRIIEATCQCNFYKTNKLMKGPCEHMLALRIMHRA